MRPTEIESGVRIVVYHGGEVLRGIVNGSPYVLAANDGTGVEVQARIPVHVPDGNRNIDVAGHNVARIGWPK